MPVVADGMVQVEYVDDSESTVIVEPSSDGSFDVEVYESQTPGVEVVEQTVVESDQPAVLQVLPGSSGVDSVNGRVGPVVLDKDDVNLDQADNTSDADKPISTATQAALDQEVADRMAAIGLVLPKAGGTMTGDIDLGGHKVIGAADATTNTGYVTLQQVDTLINSLVNGAPGFLDQLSELADAIGDDPNFATTVTNLIALRLLASNNLSDLTNVSTARTNLGLGDAATHSASDFDTPAARATAIASAITALALGTASTHAAGDFAVAAAGLPTGGTVGQRLIKQSGTNFDAAWFNNVRSDTTASSATPTINTDLLDFYTITALAADITSMTTNLSGTQYRGQKLWVAITDNGTARAIAWGSAFESSSVLLPTITVPSTRIDVLLVWNLVSSKFRCVGVA